MISKIGQGLFVADPLKAKHVSNQGRGCLTMSQTGFQGFIGGGAIVCICTEKGGCRGGVSVATVARNGLARLLFGIALGWRHQNHYCLGGSQPSGSLAF